VSKQDVIYSFLAQYIERLSTDVVTSPTFSQNWKTFADLSSTGMWHIAGSFIYGRKFTFRQARDFVCEIFHSSLVKNYGSFYIACATVEAECADLLQHSGQLQYRGGTTVYYNNKTVDLFMLFTLSFCTLNARHLLVSATQVTTDAVPWNEKMLFEFCEIISKIGRQVVPGWSLPSEHNQLAEFIKKFAKQIDATATDSRMYAIQDTVLNLHSVSPIVLSTQENG